MTEFEVVVENWERFRAVTLQHLDALDDADLAWRPDPEAFSCGQQLLHIAQTEDFYTRGLYSGEWDADLLRFPRTLPDVAGLRQYFEQVREATRAQLKTRTDADLATLCKVPHAPGDFPLRWWLWFVLEHEIHHKAQLAVYLRQMGKTAPFFAFPFPPGERPDFAARADLGGV